MRSLSVVIVTHDNREAVRGALPALTAQLDDGDELIVVDNDSSDGSVDAVRDVAPDAIVIDAGRQPRLCRRLQPRSLGGLRGAAPVPEPRRGRGARLPRGDRAAACRRPRLGRLAGTRHRRGRDGRQHPRRGGPLHRDRLGRRRRRAARPRGRIDRPRARDRARLRLGRLPRHPAGRCSSEWVASQAGSSSTTRTSTCPCGCGSPGTLWASSRPPGWNTTTSSPRGRPSGAGWSATAGPP